MAYGVRSGVIGSEGHCCKTLMRYKSRAPCDTQECIFHILLVSSRLILGMNHNHDGVESVYDYAHG